MERNSGAEVSLGKLSRFGRSQKETIAEYHEQAGRTIFAIIHMACGRICPNGDDEMTMTK